MDRIGEQHIGVPSSPTTDGSVVGCHVLPCCTCSMHFQNGVGHAPNYLGDSMWLKSHQKHPNLLSLMYVRIALVQHTKVKETVPQPNNTPLVACDLRPISTLEQRFRKNIVLSDAIGLLLELTGPIYPTGDGDPRRNLKIKDINGNDIGVTLWGQQAENFDEEAIRLASAKGNVVILFVSMNVDYFSGNLCFKGTYLTHSYINRLRPVLILASYVALSCVHIVKPDHPLTIFHSP